MSKAYRIEGSRQAETDFKSAFHWIENERLNKHINGHQD
jgi:hypothetical protein